MRYGSCVLAVVLMASPIGQDSKNQASSTTEQNEFSRLETLWNEAHRSGDADKLDGLWGEDLVVTVPRMPVMTKTQAITIWRSGRMKFRRYETSELRARRYGDAAVVTGRLRRSREVNGREIQDDWRFTKVYVRRSDKWQVVAWHASESAPG
ncbi:MAG: nuclear transport factor 2 family protein [Isosphaeraceae bacterium]